MPTLAALALRRHRAPGPSSRCSTRRGEVYAAGYDGDRSAGALRSRRARVDALADAIARLGATAACTVIGGRAAGRRTLRARFGDALRLVPPPAGLPDAVAVGRLAARLLAAGAGISAETLTPVYVRRAEAEVQRTGERFEA
jgi:tRNA A37 threonylcarbamoyladenosine modification protein TsaB